MKKIAFLVIMFFMIFSQIFADENSDKLENISFSWQLISYQGNYPKINFINLNPMFFNDYFLLNIYKNISTNNNYQSNRSVNTFSQNDNLSLFGAIIYMGALFTSWSIETNWQEREIRNDMWKQQREAENIYRSISPYPARNFYQGNSY